MKRRISIMVSAALLAAALTGCGSGGQADGPRVAIRAESLLVPPSTGPVTHVRVRNLGNWTYKGAVVAIFPDDWKLRRTAQPVTVGPGQTVRVPFSIDKAADSRSNSYAVRIKAVGDGPEVTRAQRIVCASAPYFKPKIDGEYDDWADAIPASFVTAGKKTTVSTYWSRRSFSLLVAVEEDSLRPLAEGAEEKGCDAVQVAISPGEATTPTSPSGKAERNEFLLAAAAGDGKCFSLMRRGDAVSAGQAPRALKPLELAGAAVSVKFADGVTYYECSIPIEALPGIRPEAGREICLSILVHDPDGTGLRDWGQAAGLWPSQRNRLAWSTWPGAKWPAEAPFDNKIEWGLCSSKH